MQAKHRQDRRASDVIVRVRAEHAAELERFAHGARDHEVGVLLLAENRLPLAADGCV